LLAHYSWTRALQKNERRLAVNGGKNNVFFIEACQMKEYVLVLSFYVNDGSLLKG